MSRLFESVSPSIEVFLGCFRFIEYLMPAYLFSSRLHKKMLFADDLRKMVLLQKIVF